MTVLTFGQDGRIDADTVVLHTKRQVTFASEGHEQSLTARMGEGVADRLAADGGDFVPNYRVQFRERAADGKAHDRRWRRDDALGGARQRVSLSGRSTRGVS